MIKIRRIERSKIKSEINVVPLLDVLLVLLLIFMATAPIATQSIEVDLPDTSEYKDINTNSDPPVVIEVSMAGRYSVVAGNNRVNRLSSEQIISEVQHHVYSNPRTVFLIGGAKNVPYNEIVKLLNLLHGIGIKSVGLITHPS